MTEYNISITNNSYKTTYSTPWSKCVGSDRASISKLEKWQTSVAYTQNYLDFEYMRFHGILDDDMNVYLKNSDGIITLNMEDVYTCYDFLISNNLKPFVELSFMPTSIAKYPNETVFYYDACQSPPNSYSQWGGLVSSFITSLVTKYGIDEVSNWYFEIWNEPNEATWSGTKYEYFLLYKEAATAIKGVNEKLKVGGPATAQVAWIPEFIKYVNDNELPIDFISSHVYPNDPQVNIFGVDLDLPVEDVPISGMQVAKSHILSSQLPNLPLFITEWAAQNPANIAYTLANSVNFCDFLCYWDISTIFEESGPLGKFDSEYFGLVDQYNVRRTSFWIYYWYQNLFSYHIFTGVKPCFATTDGGNNYKIIIWNLPNNSDVSKMGSIGETIEYNIFIEGKKAANITIIDPNLYEVDVLYNKWGRPETLTSDQITQLENAGNILSGSLTKMVNNTLTFTLTSNSVALIEA